MSFILCFPLADVFTGFMIFKLGMPESFIGSPSQVIRILFLLCGLTRISSNDFKRCCVLLTWLLLVELSSLFYVSSFSPFVSGLNYSFKILFIYVFYLWTDRYCRVSGNFTRFQKVIFISAVIYSLGVIIPSLLGFGAYSYREGTFGQKGLLSSANSLGIFLGIMSIIYSLKKQESLIEKAGWLTLLISLIFLATKTSLLFFMLTIILVLFKAKKRYSIPIVLMLVFSCIYYSSVILDSISLVADVIIFRFENRESLFSFFMSSRDGYVSDAFVEFFKSPIWIFKMLIGGGAFMSFRYVYHEGLSFDTLENEFFDIFFMYGLIGLSIYLGVILYELYVMMKKSYLLALLFLLFALHSILAGHIVFDGIPVMGCLLIIQMVKNYSVAKMEFKI